MKILVIGPGRHGKDTVAQLLADKYDLRFRESSWACAEILTPVLNQVNGHKSPVQHYNERHDNRQLWYELIRLFTKNDPSSLAKAILKNSDIYVGMRSIEEFEASKFLFDKVIYVDASERVDYQDPTFHIPYMFWMTRIDNNGTIEDLKATLFKSCPI